MSAHGEEFDRAWHRERVFDSRDKTIWNKSGNQQSLSGAWLGEPFCSHSWYRFARLAPVPQERPVNPLKATWRWLGYHGSNWEPLVLLATNLLFAIGGGMLATGWWFLALPLVIVAALLPVPGYLWRRRANSDDFTEDSRERLLEESLQPLLELAAQTTSKPRGERAQVMTRAVDRVANDLRRAFHDVKGLRVVVFQVSDDGSRMTPAAPAGRQDRPGPFERGTPRGDEAFAVLEGKRPFVAVDDLTKTNPDEWQGSGDGYNTFISAPIRSPEDGFGMLTMDAPAASSLPARHGPTVALFAAALGVLMAEAIRSGGGRG